MNSSVGYSSKVALRLVVNGVELVLAQVGRRDLILRRAAAEPVPPSTDAQLIVEVDGRQRRTSIVLPKGILADSHRVEYF